MLKICIPVIYLCFSVSSTCISQENLSNQGDNSMRTSLQHLIQEENVALNKEDYKSAYMTRQKIESLQKELELEKSEILLDAKQTEFDLNRSERDKQILQDELNRNSRIKIFLWSFIALLSLLIAGAYLLWRESKEVAKNLKSKMLNQAQSQKIMNEQLINSNKELQRFSHIASHDIKEPIRNIGSFTKLIKRKIEPDQQDGLQDYFDIINRSCNQIYTLIEDIMQYTRLGNTDNIPIESVDLNDMVNSITTNMHSFIADNKANIQTKNLTSINSNNSLLFIVLKNLIENGIKYNKQEEPRIMIGYEQTEYGHEISVKDNGIGISTKYRKEIFELFTRLHTRNEYDGTGLGLSIVQSCIHKLGGVIQLKSEVDLGSKFIVILPVKQLKEEGSHKVIPIGKAG